MLNSEVIRRVAIGLVFTKTRDLKRFQPPNYMHVSKKSRAIEIY